MADIELERNHGMSRDIARTAAKKLLAKAEESYNVNIDYVEGDEQDTATASHMGADILVMLDDEKIRFEVKLGFLAKAMKGKIKSGMEGGLDKYFG